MPTRRQWLAAAALVGSVGAACGPERSSLPGPVRHAPAGSIRVLSHGGERALELFRQQARAFNDEYPAIRVDVEDGGTDWFEQFQTTLSSGQRVDVLLHSDVNAGTSVRDGSLEPLEPYLAKHGDFRESDFERGAWLSMQFGGKRWGLPWDSGAYALCFNLDLFWAANLPPPDPKKRMTWDDLLGLARRVTTDANGRHPSDSGFDPGRVKVFGFNANTNWGLATFMMSNGAELLTADGKVPVDSAAAFEAIQFLADLHGKHQVWMGVAHPAAQSFEFARGNVAMALQGVWQLPRNNELKLRWGTLPAPVKKVPVSGAHFSPLTLVRSAPNKDAAWAWMAFAALSERGQRLLVDAGQMQPTRKSLEARFVDSVLPPASSYRQVFADELRGSTFRVVGDKAGTYWGGYRREWGQLWDAVLRPVYAGVKPAASVVDELRRLTEQLLRTGILPAVSSG